MLNQQFVLRWSGGRKIRWNTFGALNIFNWQRSRRFSTNPICLSKICVIGSGPAGFYASQYILKTLPQARIDIIEKLPVPFGLVRHVTFSF